MFAMSWPCETAVGQMCYLELSVLGAIGAPGIHPKGLCVPLSPFKAAARTPRVSGPDRDSHIQIFIVNTDVYTYMQHTCMRITASKH